MTYQAPGLTVAEVEQLVADAAGLAVGTAAQLTRIDQAITQAAQAACTWEGTDWWFLWASGTFPTVASTASYNLRTVNTNAMTNMLAPRRMWRSNYLIREIPYQSYLNLYRTLSTAPSGSPYAYAIGSELTAYLYPTPNAVETITVDYIRRHSKITGAGSAAADLLIPAEFQHGIYVQGAIWLIKNDKADSVSLHQCPAFVETIAQMKAAAADQYDESLSRGMVIPDDIPSIVLVDNITMLP